VKCEIYLKNFSRLRTLRNQRYLKYWQNKLKVDLLLREVLLKADPEIGHVLPVGHIRLSEEQQEVDHVRPEEEQEAGHIQELEDLCQNIYI
jgi:hypothetical protein